MRHLDVLTVGRVLLLCVAGAGTASFGQMIYQGLVPGQSTREQANAALGAPVRQIDTFTFEHAPQQGTGRIEVQYAGGLVDRIEVHFLQAIARQILVERVLNNQPSQFRRLSPSGLLVEYFGEPLLATLSYEGGDESRGADSICYFSRDGYARVTGMAPVTGAPVAVSALGSAAPGAPAPLEITEDTEFRVRLLTAVSTEKNRQGDRVSAQVLAPPAYAGDTIEGQVRESASGAKIAGSAALGLSFDILWHRGQEVAVRASVKSVINSRGVEDTDEEGRIVKKQNHLGAAALGTGAAALLGALLGGAKGAAIGAVAGAAGSAAVIQLAAQGANVSFAPGSQFVLAVRSERPDRVPMNNVAGTGGGGGGGTGFGGSGGNTQAQNRNPVNININVGRPGGGSSQQMGGSPVPGNVSLPPVQSGGSPQYPGGGTTGGFGNLALNRPTRQSSVYGGTPGAVSSIGVDGSTDGYFHTDQEMAAWWQVDLGAAYVLSEVRVYNRLDCCSERARTIQVLLSQDGGSWQTIYAHNGTVFGGADGYPLVVQLNGRTARYVRLQLAENNYLHLTEVEVYGQGGGGLLSSASGVPSAGGTPLGTTAGNTTGGAGTAPSWGNLALNRPTRESSIYNDNPGDSALGVDGNLGNIFATKLERNPWWQVDLGANYTLSEVRLFNRMDCCSERTRTIQVLLSQDGGSWQTVYAHNGTVFGGSDGHPLVVQLNGRTARYVRLQLAENNYLNLTEVEVYGQGSGGTLSSSSGVPSAGGTPLGTAAGNTTGGAGTASNWGNLALNRPTRQSSVYGGAPGNVSSIGVDGRTDGIFHTDQEMAPWWQVDLGAAYVLSEVRVYNRLDCCSERARTIQVLLSQDGGSWQTIYAHNGTVFGGADGHPLVVQLNGRTARYVRLQLAENNYLHLTEVEVYGQ